jgi:Fur family ferric uptake transcriptional regulator
MMARPQHPTPTRRQPEPHGRDCADRDLLRRLGLTVTTGRLAVLRALAGATVLLSARSLHRTLRIGGEHVGLASVYRTLAALAEADVVHTFALDGELHYRRCSPCHHHHIICIACHRVWEEQPTSVEDWVTATVARTGARLVDHRADLYVVCARCDPPTGHREPR